MHSRIVPGTTLASIDRGHTSELFLEQLECQSMEDAPQSCSGNNSGVNSVEDIPQSYSGNNLCVDSIKDTHQSCSQTTLASIDGGHTPELYREQFWCQLDGGCTPEFFPEQLDGGPTHICSENNCTLESKLSLFQAAAEFIRCISLS